MKLLGIDYGRRRIGVAITDETGVFIHGYTTLDQKKISNPINELIDIIKKENPGTIIFGIPLGPDGEETSMSLEIRDFAKHLSEKIYTEIPIRFIDESYSSIRAKEQLRFRKKKYRQKKENIDRFAACNILESFKREQ